MEVLVTNTVEHAFEKVVLLVGQVAELAKATHVLSQRGVKALLRYEHPCRRYGSELAAGCGSMVGGATLRCGK